MGKNDGRVPITVMGMEFLVSPERAAEWNGIVATAERVSKQACLACGSDDLEPQQLDQDDPLLVMCRGCGETYDEANAKLMEELDEAGRTFYCPPGLPTPDNPAWDCDICPDCTRLEYDEGAADDKRLARFADDGPNETMEDHALDHLNYG